MTNKEKIKLLKDKKKRIEVLLEELGTIDKRVTDIGIEMDDILEEVRDIAEAK